MDRNLDHNSPKPPYTIEEARYAKGMMLVKAPSLDGYKTRAARLIGDHLNGRWTHREGGYIVSLTKVKKFEALFKEGRDASAITGELYPPRDDN